MNVAAAEIRVGLVGCDTSHATAFTQILNDPTHKFHVVGARVVGAVKSSSPDIESSYGRVDGYIKELSEKWSVKIFDSIEAMCSEVDAVFIESVDGRPHLAQARLVIAAKKPLFIDKPLAGSLADAREIAITNGPTALTPADIAHLCERFWRKDSARTDSTHSGLGLALAAELARILGLQLTHDLGANSVLTVRLTSRGSGSI